MSVSSQATEVESYAAAVRAALADLPPADAEPLLEDLEDHLREIAAEADGSLTDRLGPPEAYAQELRAAFAGGPTPGGHRRSSLGRAVGGWISSLVGSGVYREIRGFMPELRPGWWVLRAYLAVLILMALASPGYDLGPLPNLGSRRGWAQLILIASAVWISVRLGRRSNALPKPARFAYVSANVLVVVFALGILWHMRSFAGVSVDQTMANQTVYQPVGTLGAGPVTNIYAYSSDGKPLTNVLLYDQDGHPIELPKDSPDTTSDYPIGADGRPITNAYPLNQRHANGDPVVAPRVAIPPWPSPSPSPKAAATATPTATP